MTGILILIVAIVFIAISYFLFVRVSSNTAYIHNKTGNKYIILHYGKMKTPDGNWVESVVYQSNKDYNIYTRELNSFYEHFTLERKWKQK